MAISDSVAQLAVDAAKMHEIVHGDASTVVTTDGGPVRSVAKLLADNQAAINAQAVLSAQLETAGGAAMIGTTPSGSLAATDLQGAIDELESEKASAAALTALAAEVDALETGKASVSALEAVEDMVVAIDADKASSADLAATGGAALVPTRHIWIASW